MTLNERCAMTLNELRALADEFFEWPIAHNKSTVTMTSALLFAQHVLQLREKALGAENSAGINALRNAAQRQLDALGGYRREIGLLTGVPDEQPCDAEIALRAALEQQAERRDTRGGEMSDLREAAQQALEALEAVDNDEHGTSFPATVSSAITDLRAALEQDESEGSVCIRCGALAFDPLVPQQAEPAQEPAGWFEGPFGAFRANQLYKIAWPASTVAWSIPLYTAPPQRKPLTDEEEAT